MNRMETTAGIVPEGRLLGHVAAPDTEEPSKVSAGLSAAALGGDTPCEDTAEGEMSPAEESGEAREWRTCLNGPTAAEVGAHFAAEIASDADEALRAAARLGPRRVLALLA